MFVKIGAYKEYQKLKEFNWVKYKGKTVKELDRALNQDLVKCPKLRKDISDMKKYAWIAVDCLVLNLLATCILSLTFKFAIPQSTAFKLTIAISNHVIFGTGAYAIYSFVKIDKFLISPPVDIERYQDSFNQTAKEYGDWINGQLKQETTEIKRWKDCVGNSDLINKPFAALNLERHQNLKNKLKIEKEAWKTTCQELQNLGILDNRANSVEPIPK